MRLICSAVSADLEAATNSAHDLVTRKGESGLQTARRAGGARRRVRRKGGQRGVACSAALPRQPPLRHCTHTPTPLSSLTHTPPSLSSVMQLSGLGSMSPDADAVCLLTAKQPQKLGETHNFQRGQWTVCNPTMDSLQLDHGLFATRLLTV